MKLDNLDKLIQNSKIETFHCNERALSFIIKWSSSKFNEYKKCEVISQIYKLYLNKDDMKEGQCVYFSTGCFSQRSNCTGIDYVVYKYNNEIYLIKYDNDLTIYKLI